jgi:hypothetical protein
MKLLNPMIMGKTVKMTGLCKSDKVKNWAGLWMRVDLWNSCFSI